MLIECVRIQNLRVFEDETIEFGKHNCLIGPNGVGKSTVLLALNVFFRDTENYATDILQLDSQDFHQEDTSKPIVITVTFTDLCDEAKADFSHYYRQGKLIVSAIAEYDKGAGHAPVEQCGERLGIKDFSVFFAKEKDGEPVRDLREVYEEMRQSHPELPPPAAKGKMMEALRAYEDGHPGECELIQSKDQFYGFSRGKNILSKYVQWVHVPAVKDAADERFESKGSALERLLERTVRSRIDFREPLDTIRDGARHQYEELLASKQNVLDDLSKALKQRVAEWAHPDAGVKLEWYQDLDKSIHIDDPFAQIKAREGSFAGDLARFGHGLQRSYLFALLQELSSSETIEGPRLILGCEEPELYQHPPQARHLADVLTRLSGKNSQVIVCTHSPYFVSGDRFEDVRMVRKDRAKSSATVTCTTADQLSNTISTAYGTGPMDSGGVLAKIHQELQPNLSELFFANLPILVEGLSDAAYITTYMHLMECWAEYRRLGCNIIVANNKGHMIRPLAIAGRLGIPTFCVFDADGDKVDKPDCRKMHEKDNLAILRLCGVSNPDPFPSKQYWGEGLVMWDSDIEEAVYSEMDEEQLDCMRSQLNAKYGHIGGLSKNPMFISELLTTAWKAGMRSSTLKTLCEKIVAFGSEQI